jgi:hypothetical protein
MIQRAPGWDIDIDTWDVPPDVTRGGKFTVPASSAETAIIRLKKTFAELYGFQPVTLKVERSTRDIIT